MVWTYFTNANPYNNTYEETFNELFNQCLIKKENLFYFLSKYNCYRFIIKTDEENDKLMCKDGSFYLKSKFLSNKNFKANLINYYKPLGIYVGGPRELIRRDGTSTNRWIIELTECSNKE